MNDLFPFEQRQREIELRRQLLAAQMRAANQPGYMENPGRMIGDRYVAPSWAQNLNGLAAPMAERSRADVIGQQLAAQEAEYESQLRGAQQRFINGIPQGIPEQAGPVDPTNPTELQAQAPSRQDQIRHAMSGLTIPGMEGTASAMVKDAMFDAPRRAEDKQFKREESVADRLARAEARQEKLTADAEALKLRLEDAKATREQRAADQEANRQLQRQIAEGNQELRRLQIEASLTTAKDKAAAAKEKAAQGKTLPAGTVKDLGELDERASTLANLASSFKDNYSGLEASIKNKAAPYVRGMDSSGADWWRDYKKQQELVERHSLFGATLTAGEQR